MKSTEESAAKVAPEPSRLFGQSVLLLDRFNVMSSRCQAQSFPTEDDCPLRVAVATRPPRKTLSGYFIKTKEHSEPSEQVACDQDMSGSHFEGMSGMPTSNITEHIFCIFKLPRSMT